VVVSVAEGGPEFAFPLPVAPMAPDPFVPEVSIPVKLITVMEAATFCESVAVTRTLLSPDTANARQISLVPLCTLVLTTKDQVRPPPETPVTVVLGPDR